MTDTLDIYIYYRMDESWRVMSQMIILSLGIIPSGEQVLLVTYLLPFQDDMIDTYCKCSVNDSALCC